MTALSFAEWRPDVAGLNTRYALDIRNVLCADGGYIPFPALALYSDAVPATPLGAITTRNDKNQVVIFCGTATKLYKLNNSTLAWEDVSQADTTYGASASERWQFEQFGPYVVAVNPNDNPQVFEIGTSTAFADLGGSPPKASYVVVCGDFLMLGGLPDNKRKIVWSALNDITGWTEGTDNSGAQVFPDGGDVMGITGGTNPIIFQKSAIRKGTFVPGSTAVFTFKKIHDERGCAAPYSISTRGAVTFYADSGGFYQIGQDGSVASIGFEKVDRTVFNKVSGANLFAIVGEVDPFYSRVYFAVRYESTTTAFDRLLIYDWGLQRWSQIAGDFEILFPLASGTIGYTLTTLAAEYTTLADVPFPLGSKVWQGGAPIMAAFDTSKKLGFFSGDAMEAVITTAEMGDIAGGVTLVKDIMPIIDTNDVRVSIGCRMKRGDTVTWANEASPSSNTGVIHKKCRARFHRFKVRIPAATKWTMAQGLDVASQPAGLR